MRPLRKASRQWLADHAEEAGHPDDPDLDIYFRDCVIGGPGAFMVPARDKAQFQQAIKAKILLEVSGLLSDRGASDQARAR